MRDGTLNGKKSLPAIHQTEDQCLGLMSYTLKKINKPFKNCCGREEKIQKKKYRKHFKKCWTTLATREMQIKTALRFRLTLVRMAITRNKNAVNEVKGELTRHCWWAWKPVWTVSQKGQQKPKANQTIKNKQKQPSTNKQTNNPSKT